MAWGSVEINAAEAVPLAAPTQVGVQEVPRSKRTVLIDMGTWGEAYNARPRMVIVEEEVRVEFGNSANGENVVAKPVRHM